MKEVAKKVQALLERVVAHEGDLFAFYTREPREAEELLRLLDLIREDLEELLVK